MPEAVGQLPLKIAARPRAAAAYWALGVLTAINLLNYLDRYVVAPLATRSQERHVALGYAAGLAAAGFHPRLHGGGADVRRVGRPRLAYAPDRPRHRHLEPRDHAVGLRGELPAPARARALVGIGEAALVAIAPSLLADLFPPQGRARVYAVLNMAIPVGAALGYVVGGEVWVHFGWRAAFFVAGAPGIVLAIASLWLPDPPRGIRMRRHAGRRAGRCRGRSRSTLTSSARALPADRARLRRLYLRPRRAGLLDADVP